MYRVKRKGLSLVECLILTIVLLVAIGAIFTVMFSAHRSYTFHQQAKDAREILFSWFQAFESQWPPPPTPNPAWLANPTARPVNIHFHENPARRANWNAAAGTPDSAITAMLNASNMLGGTWEGGARNRTRMGNYTVDVGLPPDINLGKMDVGVVIREGGGAQRVILDQTRSYNIFMVEAVADNVLVEDTP